MMFSLGSARRETRKVNFTSLANCSFFRAYSRKGQGNDSANVNRDLSTEALGD